MTADSQITVRPAEESDLTQIANLDRLAFAPLSSASTIAQEWYGGTVELPGRSLFLAVDEGTGLPVGTYTQLHTGVWLQGELFSTMGIAAVAVAPHYRGRKVAQVMLHHAIHSAEAQAMPLMMLYPFQHGFYRSLGWAWVGQPHQYRVAARQLPVYQERSRLLPFHPDSHTAAIQQVYAEAAPQHNGWLQRQAWQWRSLLAANRERYVYVAAGEVQGYVVFQYVLLEPPRNLLAIVVHEWVALTAAAYRGIVGFLGSLRDQVVTVIWNTDASDPFPHLLNEQRFDPALTTGPFEFGFTHRFGATGGGFMWRLVDVQAALEQRPIPSSEPFQLTFEVSDPVLVDRTLTVQFANGRIHCLDTPVAEAAIRISTEHLTQLFSGFRRATELKWTGEIAVTSHETDLLLARLDAALAASGPFCWDFF